ncbi:hypothetical protein DFH28DRAFT_936015 [Melampsora americana]|nr:hypothetical protein DFH28DRAFT_936015 [Melampsora americana]
MSQPTHHGFYVSGIFELEEKANKVYLTDSYSDLDDKGKGKNGAPDSASKKPMKFKANGINSDFKTPVKPLGPGSSAAIGTPNTRTPPFSTALSMVANTSQVPIDPDFENLSTLPTAPAPAKKQGRCQPKRKATNSAPDESSNKDEYRALILVQSYRMIPNHVIAFCLPKIYNKLFIKL